MKLPLVVKEVGGHIRILEDGGRGPRVATVWDDKGEPDDQHQRLARAEELVACVNHDDRGHFTKALAVIRAYNQSLNEQGKAPDGDSYNDLLDILGV